MSLYYQIEDASGVYVLEDGTGNYLLETQIVPTGADVLARYIKTAQSEANTANKTVSIAAVAVLQ